jgi:hypothetical protein
LTFGFGTDAEHPVLRNQDGDLGKSRPTELVVMSGDRIEIRPSYLLKEKKKVVSPVTTRLDNDACTAMTDVCVASEPVFEHRCEEQCHLCMQCQAFPPMCYPWRCCDTVCQDVHVGDRCVRTEQRCSQHENQWSELMFYGGLEASEIEKEEAPMVDAPLLLSGLSLHFSVLDREGKRREMDCPLSVFKPEVSMAGFTFIAQNVDGCSGIFPDDGKSQAGLGLTNSMSDPVRYFQGTLVRLWDGRISEHPREMIYYPTIDFAGSISVYSRESLAQ